MSILFAAFCAISTSQFTQSKETNPVMSNHQTLRNDGDTVKPENNGVKYGPTSNPVYPDNKSFMSYYFSHLKYNYGRNIHGDCGFVALEQMLNYYNVVLNDDIIPEYYESNVSLCSVANDVRSAVYSPGTKKEEGPFPTSGGYTDYWNYIAATKGTSLHCQLLYYYLPETPSFLPAIYWRNGNIGTPMDAIVLVANNYLSEKTPFSPEQLNMQTGLGTNNTNRAHIKLLIQSGKPVLTFARASNGEEHAFVIYDYDGANDEFYCHTGWYDDETCMPLSEFEFNYIYEYMWFDPTTIPLKKANRYKNLYDNGGNTFSVYDSLRPKNVRLSNDLFIDELPEFKWDCMVDDNLLNLYSKSYAAYICDSDTNAIISIQNLHSNKIRLTNSQYATLLSTIETDYFWFVLEFYPDTYDNLIFLRVDMPTTYSNKVHVKPCDWNSSWDRGISIPNNTITETQTINGMTFSTKRTRAWRDGSWIVVQPKKTNNNVASLEINFTDHVGAFMYSLAKRNTTETFGTVTVQVKDSNGNWSTIETVTTSLLPIAASGHPRRTIWVDSPGSSSFFPGGHGSRKNITAIKFTNTCKYNFAGALCIDDLAFDNEDVEFLNVYNYQNSWYTGYGKSCLPNNVPASGNSTGGFLNPTNPDDPIVIGTK